MPFVLTGHLPRAPPPSLCLLFPQALSVCMSVALRDRPSVPVEAAMAADNANWLPVITTNCPTARTEQTPWVGCVCGACASLACVHSKLIVFHDLVKERCVCIFQFCYTGA